MKQQQNKTKNDKEMKQRIKETDKRTRSKQNEQLK